MSSGWAGLAEFLEEAAALFELHVFTAATANYADLVRAVSLGLDPTPLAATAAATVSSAHTRLSLRSARKADAPNCHLPFWRYKEPTFFARNVGV